MKKSMFIALVALSLCSISSIASTSDSAAGGSAASFASGGYVEISGFVTASSEVALASHNWQLGTTSQVQSNADYSASGIIAASGKASVDTVAAGSAHNSGAGSHAGSYQSAAAQAFLGVSIASVNGQAISLSLAPNALSHANAQQSNMQLDAGWFTHAAVNGSVNAGTTIYGSGNAGTTAR